MSSGALVALDQSHSSTGFAVLQPEHGGAITSGAWPLCDGIEYRALGYRTLWHHLDALNKGVGIAQIVHESPALGAVNKGEAQIFAALGLVAVIELFACSRGLPEPIAYPARTWRTTWFSKVERRLIADRPKATRDWKHPAVLRARQLGFDPVTGDEAEAIGILDHYLQAHKRTPYWREGSPILACVA